MKLVAFDLETTGLEMERDRVLEFCFVELGPDLAELGRWSRLVDPGIPVSKEIEDLTGISTAMVKGQLPFSAHAPRIQQLVRDAVLVAHNHSFDVPFLDMELRRAGQPGLAPDHPCIDTLVIERHVNSHRLSEVYKRYVGTPFDGGHRSEADVLATVEVLRRQRQAHAALLPGNGVDLEGLLATNVDRHFGGEARVRHWLDHGHRFYRDPKGTVRLGFGPHRGCPAVAWHPCVNGVEGHHEEFLRWMLRRDFPTETKATVNMLLRATSPRPFSAPGQASPTTVESPGVVPAPATLPTTPEPQMTQIPQTQAASSSAPSAESAVWSGGSPA
ncbi:MAG TPA: 3'-5' exonuclease [Candidatus Thermoplasmatota archaeon]|nr:3'-5' exonuclease [Candidatus Thermoplasmatota archaeon]